MTETNSLSRRTNIFLGERHTSLFNRVAAKTIDVLIIVALFFIGRAIWPPLGVFSAIFFSAFQDGFGMGQSIGKRIIGLRVIDDRTGQGCTFIASFIRNLPLVLCVLCAPSTLLWVPLVFLGLPLIVFEAYLLLTLETGIRWGDALADSLVVEFLEEESVGY